MNCITTTVIPKGSHLSIPPKVTLTVFDVSRQPRTSGTSIVEHEIRALAAVDGEFNTRHLMATIEGMKFTRLFRALRKLTADQRIVFTGKPCVFKRLA